MKFRKNNLKKEKEVKCERYKQYIKNRMKAILKIQKFKRERDKKNKRKEKGI